MIRFADALNNLLVHASTKVYKVPFNIIQLNGVRFGFGLLNAGLMMDLAEPSMWKNVPPEHICEVITDFREHPKCALGKSPLDKLIIIIEY